MTLVNTVPSAMGELVRQGQIPGSVRVVNLAGEALGRRLVEQIYEGSEVEEVVNLYGPTEDTTYSLETTVERGEVRSGTDWAGVAQYAGVCAGWAPADGAGGSAGRVVPGRGGSGAGIYGQSGGDGRAICGGSV